MSESGHDLQHAFPDDGATLHALKLGSDHYRKLAGQHHDLTQAISRIEAGLDAASDDRLEILKKNRLGILDEIAELIAARKAA